MNRRLAGAAVALLLPLAVVACGSDDDTPSRAGAGADSTTTTAGSSAFPVTVRDVTIAGAPERIVSLSPTSTEMLFAIGAGDQVVAADEYSTFPEEAPDTELSGFRPNVEAIAEHDPDLVVVSRDTDDLVANLTELDVPTLVLPAAADLDEVYAQIEDLGTVTGQSAGADEAVAELRGEIDRVVAEVGVAGEGLTYYYELGTEYYSATSKTFIGQVLGLLGLENIADGADGASDYPQLSAEYIVEQDPDLILLADTKCCQQTAAAVAARQGWEQMKAVTGGGVVELDDDIASRWGPRISELLEAVGDAVQKVAAER